VAKIAASARQSQCEVDKTRGEGSLCILEARQSRGRGQMIESPSETVDGWTFSLNWNQQSRGMREGHPTRQVLATTVSSRLGLHWVYPACCLVTWGIVWDWLGGRERGR
jgi:hypothetical protein